MKVGFGIIGCGLIATFHARAIRDIKGAKLVACFNRTPDKAEAIASEFGCQAYTDLDAMLARPDIDVVTVATPSGAHMEPTIAAARAGKHIIVEKPLEVTLSRCDKMIAECKKARVVLSTIFPSRFHESAKLMKRAVEQEKFGRLTLGDAYVKWFRTQQYYDSGAWRGTWKLDGGGALMNQAIHSVDLLLWLMGEVAEVSAYTNMLAHERIEVEDVAAATIKFRSGALGVIEASTATFPGSLKKIELHGTHGTAVMQEEDIVTWKFAKETKQDQAILERMAGKTKTGGGASDPAAIGHHGHTELFKDTLRAIEKGFQPLSSGEEGRKSVELILAIYKAAETGKSIKLPLSSDPVLKAKKQAK